MQPYQVIQMGLGAVGRRSARLISQKQSVQLVGAIDTDPALVGRDVGEVIGLDRPLGVRVSDDVDGVLARGGDLVLHMTPTSMNYDGDDWEGNLQEILRCVAHGRNVITLTGFTYPYLRSPDQASRLDEAAKRHGVTVHGTGCNPCYVSELVPLVITGSMQRVDRVRFNRTADHTGYDSVKIARDMLGYGLPVAEFERMIEAFRRFMHYYFLESIHAVAAGLNWPPPEEIRSTIRGYPAPRPLKTVVLDCPQGHICAVTVAVEGLRGGEPVISMQWSGTVCPDDVPEGYPTPGESIWIDGEPPTGIEFTGRHPHDALGVTVGITTNYVPIVVQAEPGLKWFRELPTPVCIP
jgi:hypothetical protein